MPASTSSKISPGAEPLGGRPSSSFHPRRELAVSVFIASISRDSSPPETMRASGRRSSPGFGETKNSARSVPLADHSPSGTLSAKRTEAPIERRQVGDAAPHAAKARQHRAVAVVERGVALFAQPLDALRAGEHLPRRSQIRVFRGVVGAERRAIELGKLKGDELL